MTPKPSHAGCLVGGGKSALLQDYLIQQQLQTAKRSNQLPVKIKLTPEAYIMNNHSQDESSHQDDTHHSSSIHHTISQVQKKILAFFYIYAVLIASLYLTYAIYCYHQQTSDRRVITSPESSSSFDLLAQADQTATTAAALKSSSSQLVEQLESKLESKIHLLERYIEVIALDLEETKSRLKEREKCACSIGCSFNGTKFNDNQIWQQKCDTCVCQSGKISCSPRKCPQLQNCDDVVQLPGTCCPTCMKKCKVNKGLVRHGHTFRPTDSTGKQTKQCKCHDGLVKCEPIQQKPLTHPAAPIAATKLEPNKTVSEYLKLIRVDNQRLDLTKQDKPTASM